MLLALLGKITHAPPINSIVRALVVSDFLLISASGFLSPIAAIYISSQINGGTIAAAGFAITIFWVTKSIVQVPVSFYADRIRGEKDDYWLMVLGSAVASTVPLLYFFLVREVWQVYLVEILNGIAYGLMVPTWLGIFTRHIDKHRESTEWTLHSNAIGLGFAAAAAAGGLLAQHFGFRVIFLLVSACMFGGTAVLIGAKQRILDDRRFRRVAMADDSHEKHPLP